MVVDDWVDCVVYTYGNDGDDGNRNMNDNWQRR
jgi:hypothetical protein